MGESEGFAAGLLACMHVASDSEIAQNLLVKCQQKEATFQGFI